MPMTTIQEAIAPPEPSLTAEELIARASGMRAVLRERQAQCESDGQVSPETNAKLIAAGFYRTVQQRRFGGYEFDIPTFYKVMMEISRGCPETGWVVALTAGHALMIAAYPEAAQRSAYGSDGEFRCPASFNPIGTAVAVDGGYRVSGGWDSASGIDLSTHFIGNATVRQEGGAPGGAFQLLLRRDQYTIDHNWHVMGMGGTGSKRVVCKDVFVPTEHTAPMAGPGRQPASGRRGYSNPMYSGRIGPFLIAESASVCVGGARGALDLYAEMMKSKLSMFPPFTPRSEDPEYLAHYGHALSLISTAEAALVRAGEEFMAYAGEDAAGGAPFDDEKEHRLTLIEQKCIMMAWEAMDLMYRTAGTSASAKEGAMLGRYFRNLAVANTHPALQLARTELAAARARFAAPASSREG